MEIQKLQEEIVAKDLKIAALKAGWMCYKIE